MKIHVTSHIISEIQRAESNPLHPFMPRTWHSSQTQTSTPPSTHTPTRMTEDKFSRLSLHADELGQEWRSLKTITYLSLSKVWWFYGWILLWQVEGNIFHKPPKWFAAQFLSKFLLLGDVTRTNVTIMRSSFIQIFLIFIHPYLSHTTVVLIDDKKKSENMKVTLYSENLHKTVTKLLTPCTTPSGHHKFCTNCQNMRDTSEFRFTSGQFWILEYKTKACDNVGYAVMQFNVMNWQKRVKSK